MHKSLVGKGYCFTEYWIPILAISDKQSNSEYIICIVDKNIIGAPKRQNIMVHCQILLYQYCDSNIRLASHKVIALSTLW